MIEAFLFDLDGTLVTMEFDVPLLRQEISQIFEKYGISNYTFTKPLLESLAEIEIMLQRKGIDPTPCRKEVLELIERREEEGSERTKPIPGAQEFLSYLKQKGYKIAVVTRTNRRSAQISLQRSGLAPYVDVLFSRGDVENIKPHPTHLLRAMEHLGVEPQRCVMVGDHAMDIEVGRTVGCITVGVLSGTGTPESLKEADYLVKTVPEMKAILKI